MFQNLKVDVIYYKTNTDFEMEFNLCGCCRMRLLTDKSADLKSFVAHLSRAVSRSKIIIIVGNLFGEEGTLNTVASAIKSKLCTVNNSEFGITGDHKIEILDGATPLVTEDGYFGGCIIEKGPQTMIFLTENKSIRKPILQNLIHPYVAEFYALDLQSNSQAQSTVVTEPVAAADIKDIDETSETISDESEPEQASLTTEETVEEPLVDEEVQAESEQTDEEIQQDINEESQEPAQQTDDITEDKVKEENEEPLQQSDDSTEDDVAVENKELAQQEAPPVLEGNAQEEKTINQSSENDFELFFEPSSLNVKKARRMNYEYMMAENERERYIMGDEDYTQSRASRTLNIPIIIIAILLLAVVVIICYCMFFAPAQEGISSAEYLRETFNTLFG